MLEQIKRHKGVTILIAFIFLFRIYTLFLHRIPAWDESVYVGIGKYLFSAGTAGLFEDIRALGLPFITGFLWKIGLNPFIAGEFVITFFTMGVVLLIYLIALNFMKKSYAMIAALLFFFTPVVFKYHIEIMTEMPVVFFGLLSVYFLIKNKHAFWIGLLAGISFLFRFPMALLFFALIAVYLIDIYYKHSKWKHLFYLCLGGFVALLPFFIFNLIIYYPQYNLFEALIHPVLQNNRLFSGEYAWYWDLGYSFYFKELVMQNFVLLFAFVGLFYYVKNQHYRLRKYNLLIIALIIILAYLTLQKWKSDRFLIILLPFLILLAVYGISQVKARHFKYAAYLLTVIFLVLSFIKINQLCPYKFEKQAVLSDYYEKFSDVNGTILTTDPAIAMFTDALLIPAYNNLSFAEQTYEEYKGKVDYVQWSDSFPCRETDNVCKENKAKLFQKIESENTLLFEKENNYLFRVELE